MGGRSGSPVARLARCAFGRRNPLARRSDRVEGVVLVVAAVVCLVALPFAVAVGSAVHGSRSAAWHEETATRHQATAVLLADAPPVTRTLDQAGGVRVSPVAASWRLPDGSTRTGRVAAADGARAGGAVRIWLDDRGSVTGPPAAPVSPVVGAVVIASALWAAVVALMGALCESVRWVNRRASLRRWDAEWAAVGPRWSR